MNSLINGVAYSWSTITILIGSQILTGCEGISYGESREITDLYGVGSNPVTRSYGNITREGSITLHMNELQALVLASPDGKLHSIPEFSIIVAFLPEGGATPIKHKLTNVRMLNNGVDMAQNDGQVSTEISLAIGDIEWAA